MPERVTEGEGYKRQLSLTAIGGLADESNDNQVESGEYIVQRYTRAGEALVKISEVAITAESASEGDLNTALPTDATLAGGSVLTGHPAYTTGTMNALSLATDGDLRVTITDAQAVHDATVASECVLVAGRASASLDTPDEGDQAALSVDLTNQLRVTSANVQGTHDFAAPTQVVMQGQFAETTVPTAVADGDVVRQWVDEYGRPIGKTDDLSSGSTLVTQTDSPRVAYIGPFTNAQIDEPGVTTAVGIKGCPHWTFGIVVGGTPLASTIEAEGTVDDTNFFTLTPETTAKAGLAVANCVGTISAAGNYEWKGTAAVSQIRLKVMGDSGSPDSATFDVTTAASA